MSDLTIDKLGGAVQNFLSNQYPPIAGATTVFAAQPGGLPVDTSAFASNLLLPAQEINDLADITARALAGQFWPTLIKASGLYEILLSGIPTDGMTGDQLAEFGKLRGSADENFHNQLAGISATPANWWDMTANSNWTTHTTSSDDITGSLPPPVLPWHWHVLPPQHFPILSLGLHPGVLPIDRAMSIAAVHLSPSVTGTTSVVRPEMVGLHQTVATSAAESLKATTFAAQSLNTTALSTESLEATMSSAQPISVTAASARPVSMIASSRAIAQLVSVSSIQAVQAEHLGVSFDYCLVNLSRAWWNGLFVATKGWYIPTYGAGDLAMGSVDGSGGQCPTIPTAMILVRNVSISGSWSEQDRTAIPNAASFGPISLIGRSIDSNLTISIPGMQAVGWMTDILPILPPMSDPNLSTLGVQPSAGALDALPTLASGQQGPAVARLQGLLRADTAGSTDATLAIDSNYGPNTVSAVQAFQQRNGINSNGIVDEATWRKLLGLS